jgi:hypothetical protein
MITIILMDDTFTDSGHMANSCQAGLLKQGFNCVFEGGRTKVGGPLLASPVLQGKRLKERIIAEQAEGVVLDIVWGEFPWNGFDIWREAKNEGLVLDQNQVVFLTQHRSRGELDELADENGFSSKQLLYKNAQGNEAAVRWFCRKFGVPFSP